MSNQNEIVKTKLIRDLEELYYRLGIVNSCIEFYKQMNEALHEYPDIMKASLNYFNTVTLAYDYVITIELAKMYDCDKRDKPVSIPNVLEKCINNPQIFEPLDRSFTLSGFFGDQKIVKVLYPRDDNFIEIIIMIIKMLDKIRMVKEYRDKFFAHNDKKYFTSKELLIKKYPFDFDLLRSLSDTTFYIIDMLYEGLTNRRFGFPPILQSFDFYNLIDRHK